MDSTSTVLFAKFLTRPIIIVLLLQPVSSLLSKQLGGLSLKYLQQLDNEPHPDRHDVYRQGYQTVVVTTNKGQVRGFRYKTDRLNEGLIFQGVPFAEPPVGNLRFAKPVKKHPWTGILDTFNFEAGCIQIKVPGIPDRTYGRKSEDCLYLNIYAPVDALDGNKNYPIIYYSYGGAFDFGSPRIFYPEFLIDNFVSQGIIMILTNFRVAALSYFSTGTSDAPGNLQLHDIIQGLRWTNEEIHNFGGDPSRITIMGHSSGGTDTVHLTLTPLTDGLYSQAIVMSGAGIVPRMINNDLSWYRKTADAVGCADDWEKNPARVVACMRNADGQNITDLYNVLRDSVQVSASRIDGDVFPEPLENLAAKRRSTNYLLGTVSNEIPIGLRSDPAPSRSMLRKLCKDAATDAMLPQVTEACLHFYDVHQRRRDEQHFDYMNQRTKLLISDYRTYAPVFKDANYMRRAGGKVYLYNFEYVKKGTEEIAVNHAMDLFFIFGYPQLGQFDENDLKIRSMYSTLLCNFVKYGNPTPEAPNVSTWLPLRSPLGFNYYRINTNSSSEEFYHFDAVQFWNSVVHYL